MSNTASDRSKKSSPLFQKVSFLLFLAAISAVFVYMVRIFIMPLLMAAIFTGLTYPIYKRLLRRFKSPSLTSAISLTLFILVIVLPVAAVAGIAYHEAVSFLSSSNLQALPALLEKVVQQAHQRFPALFARWNNQSNHQLALQGMQAGAQWLLQHGAVWSLTAAQNVGSVFLMLFMMFYFYIDGHRILQKIVRWSPLRDDYEEILLRNFLAVSRATVKGILVMGAVQGTIGAILFWCVGVHSAIFLGVLMLFCSIIPAFGTSIVWVPVAAYLLIQGRVGGGIAVILVGIFIIGTVDNFLRPKLVGKDIQMHDLMVLISTLGGLAVFGLPGFIVGPIIASLFLSIWTMYEEVFAPELERNRVAGREDSQN